MSVPVIDFRHWTGEDPALRSGFVKALGEGLERFGFVAVAHAEIDPLLVERCYDTAAELFRLPDPVKRRYETPENGRQRGYTGLGVEHAKDHDQPDLKEFWHIGRDLAADHPLTVSGEVPPNQYPTEVASARDDFSALFRAQDRFVHGLLAAVATYIDQPRDFFDDALHEGNSVLRLIHYPPLGPDAPPGAVRAAEHEDINLLTVLPISREPGLELLTREGQWMAVNPPPGVMLCDTGDMMQLLTGGRLPATTHRVVNPPSADAHRPRNSMPFFCHPRPDFLLKPLWSSGRAITARDFLLERLSEIGVA